MVLKPTIDGTLRGPLMRDLEDIRAISGEFTLGEGAEEIYNGWRTESEESQVFTDPRLEYYVQRRPTHLFKMSMIHSASRTSDRVVNAKDMNKAIEVLHSTEKDMENVFAGIGSNPLASVQHRLRMYVKVRKEVTLEEVSERFSDDASYSQLQECIAGLQSMKYIQQELTSSKIRYIKED